MILSILFALVIILALICSNRRSIITLAISSRLLGIIFLMLSAIFYISSISLYKYTNFIDYKLLGIFLKFNMCFSDVSRLLNFGFILIFTSSLLLFIRFGRKKGLYTFILICVISFFAIINDPSITGKIYFIINSHSQNPYSKNILSMIAASNSFSLYCILFFIALPTVTLVTYAIGSKSYSKIQSSIILNSVFFIVDIYILALFICGPFNIFMPYNVDLFKYPTMPINLSSSELIQYFMFFVLIFVFVALYYFKPFNNLTIITLREHKRTVQQLNTNMRSLFHTYKNLFFTIQGLSEQAMNSIKTDKDVSYEKLKYLNEMAEDSVTHITRTLNMLKSINQGSFCTNIIECVENAISHVYIPKHIHIERIYLMTEANVKADKNHLTDSFINIIQNSVEAINIKNTDQGIIKIEIFDDDDLIVINFFDNGCGIKKANKKQIFTLMFSTKQSTTNCGIGLNYVKNVISAFHGTIHVKSVEGDYTKLQLTLPKATFKNQIRKRGLLK